MIFTFHPNSFVKTLKKGTLAVLLFTFLTSKAQTTIWSENFEGCTNNAAIESGGCGWSTYAITSSSHNYFAATNSATDSYRINANKNLTVFGDPAGAADDYHYDKYQFTNEIAYYATKIDARTYTALKLNYKWKALGDGTNADYGAICYSTNGTTWTDLSPKLYNQSSTQTVANFSISSLDLTQFYIGVRWVNDDNVDGMPPITIDDMSITGTVVLPVQLIDFKAVLKNKTVDLAWKTTYEKDNKSFLIERSFDGSNFDSIGLVGGHGNSNQLTNYSFSESIGANTTSNLLYYRLKQKDNDDNFTYSDIFSVLNTTNQETIAKNFILIAPNPVTKNTPTEISLTGFLPMESVELILEDILGKCVYCTKQTTDKDGTLTFLLNADFPTGEYLLVDGNAFFVKKIIIK